MGIDMPVMMPPVLTAPTDAPQGFFDQLTKMAGRKARCCPGRKQQPEKKKSAPKKKSVSPKKKSVPKKSTKKLPAHIIPKTEETEVETEIKQEVAPKVETQPL